MVYGEISNGIINYLKYECDECKGTGEIKKITKICVQENDEYKDPSYEIPMVYRCTKCKGTGELNWLERIFGKMKNKEDDDFLELLKMLTKDY